MPKKNLNDIYKDNLKKFEKEFQEERDTIKNRANHLLEILPYLEQDPVRNWDLTLGIKKEISSLGWRLVQLEEIADSVRQILKSSNQIK